ncbi:tetratricopeptide repeat protein [Fibrella forsythiae]|uniref:Tetratricopeptide repeat protein n=1 Tax=Fibrella forsythiae TaxID=2817061 RepID=A0ABS3JAY3_9BACT|nr:tetratricopeptide repeat protein [Fibrella forsythiae]MBO0947149.1 tetratricopeptide repeat protein [Fibrella forsythiae]
METATYPVAILALQHALGQEKESAIRQAVGQCLMSMEVVAHPILGGGMFMMAGHYFLRQKQYADARTLYQQGNKVYSDAYALAIPGADWLCVQAMLCEAQTYYRAGKHPQALRVWQDTHRFASALPDPSPLSIEVAVRLAEAYRRDGQRRQSVALYEEALTLAEWLPRSLCPVPLLHVVHKNYLPLLDITHDRRRLQVRIDTLLKEPDVV